ncbi:ATPase component NikO of energizing module of nickel ECF transporter [Methanosarcina barkeri str. Wiesmoor]|uniref:ATPase component NikO of energizing module of nickel ECF transporter n=2 Tax=Methanosarcina barkeri TaxID=2208 RepID=A0A0E3LMF2_METBA|nr:energy-coupling factor ABC transporter ATP-binding protein [Methanosarcina barkeri]AKB52916.1 ATPase component NikO of energizing module of nickel ECF transporter [Methanosarcina barkeri str. Wiesmoor]
MGTIFELRNVSYSYTGKINALKDINFKVNSGEQISIIGSNGSGKSTLLAILDGLIYPTAGEFYAFDNMVIEEVFDTIKDNKFRSYFRTRVGFVFQNSDVQLFSSTVFEEIAFGPLQLNMTPEDVKTRVMEVLEMMELTKLKDRAPHTLSGGEKKKVCIATILATNPDILLLDEPTAGLDPRTQLWLTELLQELGNRGKTIIIATHDLELVEQISKRAIVMSEDHRIVADGNAEKVLDNLELLLSTNLIHEHMHFHGKLVHEHLHAHDKEHMHEHET